VRAISCQKRRQTRAGGSSALAASSRKVHWKKREGGEEGYEGGRKDNIDSTQQKRIMGRRRDRDAPLKRSRKKKTLRSSIRAGGKKARSQKRVWSEGPGTHRERRINMSTL